MIDYDNPNLPYLTDEIFKLPMDVQNRLRDECNSVLAGMDETQVSGRLPDVLRFMGRIRGVLAAYLLHTGPYRGFVNPAHAAEYGRPVRRKPAAPTKEMLRQVLLGRFAHNPEAQEMAQVAFEMAEAADTLYGRVKHYEQQLQEIEEATDLAVDMTQKLADEYELLRGLLEESEADLDDAEDDRKETQKLLDEALKELNASQRELDEARKELEESQKELDASQRTVDELLKQLDEERSKLAATHLKDDDLASSLVNRD